MKKKYQAILIGITAVLTLSILNSCSKKDVVEEEPGFQAGETTPAAPDASTSTAGAGDLGATSSDLETVQFDYNSYALNGTARQSLKKSASWLKDHPTATVQIEGHCDERGTTEYNLALGERRAKAVKDYLTRSGIEESRLSIISYGEERPVEPGHDESAWAKNRRASFVTLSQ